jgi:hypothetical protein
MGFFKKLFKGVKKVFKKIGSGIKKAVGKVGKFMGKLGIVGQIGLGLLLPGIGSMMGTMFGNLAGSLMGSTLGGLGGAVVRGAGQVINAAVNIGTKASSMFSSITEGVFKVVGQVAGTTLNKLGMTDVVGKMGWDISKMQNFGDVWNTAQTAISDVAAKGGDLFSMDTLRAENIFSTTRSAEAALAGTDTGSTFSDSMLEDLPETIQPYKDPMKAAIPEGTLGDSVEGFRAAQEVSGVSAAPQGTLAEAVDGFRTAQEVTTGVVQPQPSLLSKAGSTLASRAKEAVTDIPGQFSQAAIANLTAIPRDIVRSAMAPTPEVTYNVRQPSIPDIGFAGIGQEFAQPAFDPVSYYDQNQVAFNQRPFGFGAAVYGEANYFRNMQSYGFQVPMYGMS